MWVEEGIIVKGVGIFIFFFWFLGLEKSNSVRVWVYRVFGFVYFNVVL